MRRGPVLALAAVCLAWPWLVGAGQPATGTLKVGTPGLVVTVRSAIRGTARTECVVSDAKEATLRPGRYEAVSIRYSAKDEKGQTWTMTCPKDCGRLATIEVAEGNATVIEAGPPLVAKTTVEVQEARPPRGSVRAPEAGAPKVLAVVYRLEGQAGESYEPRAMRGVTPGPLPAVRIVDEAGKVLAEGRYWPGRRVAVGLGSSIAE
ncbi:MAG: hypothetical protein IMZ69_04480, partial [Spirochaetes bacterium]|nr:hypothetical protein [Spirochaetota bacterium]